MSDKANVTRVLYCESSADGTIGGSHYCLAYLVENLDRQRFEPTVVFYEHHPLIPRFQAAAETVILPQDQPVRWGEGRSGAAALPSVLARRIVNTGKFLGTVASNVRFLRSRKIGLVHLNNSITRHQNWILAALIARVPCIVHERGLSASYTAMDRAYARAANLIIPMSAWIRDHMVARGVSGHNIRVMYDGLDPASVPVVTPAAAVREAWKIAPHQTVIGMVGNLRPWKGQETVVRALIEVVKKWPDIVCLFVGAPTVADEAYQRRLQQLVREAGIEPNVRFTGYQKDVASLVNSMELVIHASIEPEPFGMVVLEAMAQRKAVVGSRAGGVIEMVVEGETGFTFEPGDSKMLAERIATLLADPDRRAQMGQRGYQRLLSNFTIERYMTQIHAAYGAALGDRRVSAGMDLASSADRANQ